MWVPGAPGGLPCRVWGPLVQMQPWKLEICHLKLGLILSPSGSLVHPASWALTFPWTGVGLASHALLWSPPCPAHLAEAEKRRQDGRHVCSFEHSAAPTPALYRWGDHGALEDKQDVVLGGCRLPSGFPQLWTCSKGKPLHGPGSTVSREGSGGISASTWGLSSLSFCLVWPPALEGGTQVLVLSQPQTVWLQIGLRTWFYQSPAEMEFILVFGQFTNNCIAPTLYQALVSHSRSTPTTQVNPSSVGGWRTQILPNVGIKG